MLLLQVLKAEQLNFLLQPVDFCRVHVAASPMQQHLLQIACKNKRQA